MQNIIAVLFEVESEGYQAITKLKQAPLTDGYAILQMALVKRQDGSVTLCDGFDSGLNTKDNTLKGGLMGGLIGILGGPVGVLLMGSYGAMLGKMVDLGDAAGGASMIEMVVNKLQDGSVALVLYADEKDESVLDGLLGSDFKVEILRYDAAAIAAEVDEAVMVQEEMARQVRGKLRETRKAEFREKVEEKRARVKEDFEEVWKGLKSFDGDPMVD